MRRLATSSIAFAIVVLLTSTTNAVADTPDHLVCRRFREAGPKAVYSADVVSAAYAGTGCTIKAPGKLFCDQTVVSNVNPPPPFAQYHGRGNPGRFICYAMKCPTDADVVTMTDPLGTHTLEVRGGPKLLCVPEIATEFSSCAGPGATCNSCDFGCAAHQDPSLPPNVCVDPARCYNPDVFCTSDAGCLPGDACVENPFASGTVCCSPCPP